MDSKYLRRASAFAAAGVLSMMAGVIGWADEKPSGHPATPESEMRYKGAPLATEPEKAEEHVTPKSTTTYCRGVQASETDIF